MPLCIHFTPGSLKYIKLTDTHCPLIATLRGKQQLRRLAVQVLRMNLSYESVYNRRWTNLVRLFCTAIGDLVRSARDADTGKTFFSKTADFPRGRTLVPGLGFVQALRTRSGRGLGIQLPVENGKVVGRLYWCRRQLITSSLFFTKLSRKSILLGRNQYFAWLFWWSMTPTPLSTSVTNYRR